ncbi:uncharacterized protein LOC118241290 [Electrophorus electricus]|uniref:uncharacterized protein LOC118241290 n=1 Tax=Electrophorus electricus TaxID=8005 RepID=UPI0015D067DC|nr:uncharacterized protein LOC118241290 [Electrophorus electricus]
MIVDYRKLWKEVTPPPINGAKVESFSVYTSPMSNTALRSAHQRLFFLRRFRKFDLPPDILTIFYRCTVESILTGFISLELVGPGVLQSAVVGLGVRSYGFDNRRQWVQGVRRRSCGLFPVSLYSQNTQMAEPGVDVTMWCQHSLHGSGSIFWIKQTSNSVPQCVACKNHKSKNCYFFTPNNRTVMSVNDKNASLTITVVDPTDSGLYYCSLLLNDKITFSNTTYLHVKDRNETPESINITKEGDCVGLFTLTVAFGAATVFLLSSLLIIYNKQKNRKDTKDGNSDILHTKEV